MEQTPLRAGAIADVVEIAEHDGIAVGERRDVLSIPIGADTSIWGRQRIRRLCVSGGDGETSMDEHRGPHQA
ncbi:MAG TPA: hypothetical protein VLF18_14415 [Tahibacter sp.]|uniref:hypothetical protein n=1 Tax=Tahibacter sp. TaxID=2056211 RepID=UPI002CF34146|nr:hypothetical protein [Tahibacter sp.]HSX61392.1 hypothetical protein [Tahibacter sp.]